MEYRSEQQARLNAEINRQVLEAQQPEEMPAAAPQGVAERIATQRREVEALARSGGVRVYGPNV
jgi:hypothetical protein